MARSVYGLLFGLGRGLGMGLGRGQMTRSLALMLS